jgi:hypothetical protein
MLKKRCPSRRKLVPIPMPGGSLTAPLACALFQQETVVRATIQALLDAFAEKSELDPMLMLLLLLLLCFVAVMAAVFVTFCFSKARDLTRPGQGPANIPKCQKAWNKCP